MASLNSCRACTASSPTLFLPLGDHPPANGFIRAADMEREQAAYPLNTQICLECGLIQVADQVPEDFFRHYLYVPSSASSMHTHFAELASVLTLEAGRELIVDIGCNDGLLLSACNELGAYTLGIDPAANLAEIAANRGVTVDVGYFTERNAQSHLRRYGPARVIVTTNTFNHIGDLHDFMSGVVTWLSRDGTFVVEVPWAKDLLENNEFDTVYHEHVSEFSLLSIVKLGEQSGLEVVDVQRLGVHGGSLRIFMKRAGYGATAKPIVQELLKEEIDAGMLEAATYRAFANRIEKVRSDLLRMIAELKSQGKIIAGYGAPAKGNTLLNYFRIGPDMLDYLIDRNPLKQGLYSPGMKIPIRSLDAMRENRPDVLLVLAWNFIDEIREQQKDFIANGGRLLVPLPSPVLLN
jgi:SAM-dependent methyltransferase